MSVAPYAKVLILKCRRGRSRHRWHPPECWRVLRNPETFKEVRLETLAGGFEQCNCDAIRQGGKQPARTRMLPGLYERTVRP